MTDFKALSLDLLKLVVIHDRLAVAEINNACKQFSFDVSYELTFEFYRKGRWEEFCDCWYINEYFEYCTDSVDIDSFLKLSEYFTQGHCPHVVGQLPENTAVSGISLIHAATAAGNIDVVKYIIQKNKAERLHDTRSAELLPFVIAVIKNQSNILKVVLPSGKKESRVFHEFFLIGGKSMKFARRDPDTSATVLVKMKSFQWNPFVWCFFLNIVPSKKVIQIISKFLSACDITSLLQYVIYLHDAQTTANIVSAFAEFVSTFDSKLAVECVLWNKPEALSVILQKVSDLNIRVYDFHLNSIAKFLGHDECSKILLELCRKRKKYKLQRKAPDLNSDSWDTDEHGVISRMSPYSIMLGLYDVSKFIYDEKSLGSLFLKISSSRYDVNQSDNLGMTPLHIALETVKHKESLIEVLETLFSQGADPNIKDINGRSALYVALTPFNSPRGLQHTVVTENNFLRTMKLILFNNAVPKDTPNAVYYAIFQDIRNSLLRYIDDKRAKVLLATNPENGNKIFAKATRERVLALSYVAILMELGFPVGKFVFDFFTRLPCSLHGYINKTLSSPRSLESRCRNFIRETYPGPRLRKVLNSIDIPEYFVDVILFEPYLQRTKIILSSGDVIDDLYGEDILRL